MFGYLAEPVLSIQRDVLWSKSRYFSSFQAESVKMQPLYTQFVPFQLQHDPTTKQPAKLVHRIENLEFLEMAGMLPKTWVSVIPLTHDSAMFRWPITQWANSLVWIECFSLY